MSSRGRGRGGWRGRGNYRGRGGGRGGSNSGGDGAKSVKVKMTFVNSRLQLNFAYNKTLVEVIKTVEVWG